ncbi:hypothetical protein FPCIR_2620 [Fusarium pseudocircinatum]|uniref:Uncharacterized protein n=1 Tax=Fusarium pseudocircinatum TaxID=56676 RepID=A0A8H5PLM2_9HYPO|nr:hypothetical protein FPCIR_2620 [Fusarium pseudocircinatum]
MSLLQYRWKGLRLNDTPAGPVDMAPGDKWHHHINPMGRLRLVVVVLGLWTAIDAILKAHGKQYVINSTNYTPKNAKRYREHAQVREWLDNNRLRLVEGDDKHQVWVVAVEAYDKIDTTTVRAPGFIPDDVATEASGVKMAIRVVTGYLCFHDLLVALQAGKFSLRLSSLANRF